MAGLSLSVSEPPVTNPLCSSTLREAGLSSVSLPRSLLSPYSVAASSPRAPCALPLWPVAAPRPSARSGIPAPPTRLPLRSYLEPAARPAWSQSVRVSEALEAAEVASKVTSSSSSEPPVQGHCLFPALHLGGP